MSKVILISGKKRSGKDYVSSLLAKSLTELGHSVDIHPFAAPLKQMVSIGLGISLEQLEVAKNDPKAYPVVMRDYISVTNITDCRAILQRFGTEAVKPIFGNDVWHRLMLEYIANSSADYILVPDFRFPVEYINNAITVRVDCNLTDKSDSHESETALDDYTFHHILNNNDYGLTPEHLKQFALRITNE